jgi:serine phosphatase RsbU (regulator of sigma subunit)
VKIMLAWTQRILEIDTSGPQVGAATPLPAPENPQGDQLRVLRDELDTLRREQAKLQQAVFEAAQVQRRLCAPRELSWSEFEIAGEIFPVRHLSGDFFKVIELGSALGLVLGDIAGKGLTAGIWQAHLMGLVQQCARKHANPAEVLAEVNQELCLTGEPPMTALFFARINPQTNELTYCNAGLPAPLLLRGDKVVNRLDTGGPMLGAVKDAGFESASITLDPGDMLVAYSDGVTECRNAQDDEFEMERLTAAAKAVVGRSASKTLFSLLGTVLDFAGSCSPGDDMTLLVVRRRPLIKNESGLSRAKDLSAPSRRSARSRRRKTSTGEDTVPTI